MIKHNEIDFSNPKSLFKFSKVSEYTYSALLNKTVFLSKAIDLNDPFELDIDFDTNLSEEEILSLGEPASTNSSSLNEILERAKNKLNDMLARNRILSLSSNPYELLMWSHYADEHKGICIEYDRQNCELLGDDELCKKVIYPRLTAKTKIKLLPLFFGYTESKKLFDTVIFARKASNWEYENEWRLVLEDTDDINIQLLHNSVRVKSITFGLRTPSHHKSAIFALVEKFYEGEVLFYQAVKSDADISINIVKFEPSEHIDAFMAPEFENTKNSRNLTRQSR